VYTCEPGAEVLTTEGLHVPVIGVELDELAGNTSGVAFWQYGPNGVKVGDTGAVMVIFMVVTVPHVPKPGVNVYVWVPTVEVLMTDGDQVPVIDGELLELEGKIPDVAF
jgi:hypothetical protein